MTDPHPVPRYTGPGSVALSLRALAASAELPAEAADEIEAIIADGPPEWVREIVAEMERENDGNA